MISVICLLSTEPMVDFAALQAENARLIALLESQGIEWRLPPKPESPIQAPESKFSTAEKITLFRRLFHGRTDVYPVRWEGKTSGKSGYAPVCANEWRAGVWVIEWDQQSKSCEKSD
jgi:hypothetical protein